MTASPDGVEQKSSTAHGIYAAGSREHTNRIDQQTGRRVVDCFAQLTVRFQTEVLACRLLASRDCLFTSLNHFSIPLELHLGTPT